MVEHQVVHQAFGLDLYVDVAELVNFVEIVFRVDLLVDHYQGDLSLVQIDQAALLVVEEVVCLAEE